MSESFSVGEVAVGHGFVHSAHRNGMECVIIEPLHKSMYRLTTTSEIGVGFGYSVRWSDGTETFQLPTELRKKRPPDHPDNVTSWDSMPWWPEKLVREQPVTT